MFSFFYPPIKYFFPIFPFIFFAFFSSYFKHLFKSLDIKLLILRIIIKFLNALMIWSKWTSNTSYAVISSVIEWIYFYPLLPYVFPYIRIKPVINRINYSAPIFFH